MFARETTLHREWNYKQLFKYNINKFYGILSFGKTYFIAKPVSTRVFN